MLAWLLLGCSPSVAPVPTLAARACQYYQACEPAFILAFPSIDSCIELLGDGVGALSVCGANLDTLENCGEQLAEAIGTCAPIDNGACGQALSCVDSQCEQVVGSVVDRCPNVDDSQTEVILATCQLSNLAADCIAECIGSASCDGLEQYPGSIISNCLYVCDAL